MKNCTSCGVELTENNSFINTDTKRSKSKCKPCIYRKEKPAAILWMANNTEKRKQTKREYENKPENREKIKKYVKSRKHIRNKVRKDKYKNDPAFNLEHRYRSRVQVLIRNALKSRDTRYLDYLGCKRDFFTQYIESKFLNGMGWHNRSLWHIDHIEPCCSFDLTKMDDVLKCFHYTNLRPLWSQDNTRKLKLDISWKKEKLNQKSQLQAQM